MEELKLGCTFRAYPTPPYLRMYSPRWFCFELSIGTSDDGNPEYKEVLDDLYAKSKEGKFRMYIDGINRRYYIKYEAEKAKEILNFIKYWGFKVKTKGECTLKEATAEDLEYGKQIRSGSHPKLNEMRDESIRLGERWKAEHPRVRCNFHLDNRFCTINVEGFDKDLFECLYAIRGIRRVRYNFDRNPNAPVTYEGEGFNVSFVCTLYKDNIDAIQKLLERADVQWTGTDETYASYLQELEERNLNETCPAKEVDDWIWFSETEDPFHLGFKSVMRGFTPMESYYILQYSNSEEYNKGKPFAFRGFNTEAKKYYLALCKYFNLLYGLDLEREIRLSIKNSIKKKEFDGDRERITRRLFGYDVASLFQILYLQGMERVSKEYASYNEAKKRAKEKKFKSSLNAEAIVIADSTASDTIAERKAEYANEILGQPMPEEVDTLLPEEFRDLKDETEDADEIPFLVRLCNIERREEPLPPLSKKELARREAYQHYLETSCCTEDKPKMSKIARAIKKVRVRIVDKRDDYWDDYVDKYPEYEMEEIMEKMKRRESLDVMEHVSEIKESEVSNLRNDSDGNSSQTIDVEAIERMDDTPSEHVEHTTENAHTVYADERLEPEVLTEKSTEKELSISDVLSCLKAMTQELHSLREDFYAMRAEFVEMKYHSDGNLHGEDLITANDHQVSSPRETTIVSDDPSELDKSKYSSNVKKVSLFKTPHSVRKVIEYRNVPHFIEITDVNDEELSKVVFTTTKGSGDFTTRIILNEMDVTETDFVKIVPDSDKNSLEFVTSGEDESMRDRDQDIKAKEAQSDIESKVIVDAEDLVINEDDTKETILEKFEKIESQFKDRFSEEAIEAKMRIIKLKDHPKNLKKISLAQKLARDGDVDQISWDESVEPARKLRLKKFEDGTAIDISDSDIRTCRYILTDTPPYWRRLIFISDGVYVDPEDKEMAKKYRFGMTQEEMIENEKLPEGDPNYHFGVPLTTENLVRVAIDAANEEKEKKHETIYDKNLGIKGQDDPNEPTCIVIKDESRETGYTVPEEPEPRKVTVVIPPNWKTDPVVRTEEEIKEYRENLRLQIEEQQEKRKKKKKDREEAILAERLKDPEVIKELEAEALEPENISDGNDTIAHEKESEDVLGGELLPFQEEGVNYALEKKKVIIADEMGCVSGDSKVYVKFYNSKGDEKELVVTVAKLYSIMQKYSRFKFTIMGVDEDKKVLCFNAIDKVISRGKKVVYQISLTNGSNLKLTEDHPVYTKDGYKLVRDLEKGDMVYSCLKYSSIESDLELSMLLSVEPLGEEDVYDIANTEDSYHNFISKGIVIHNCGKTIEALAAYYLTHIKNCLIVCPNTLKYNWYNEARRWVPGRKVVVLEVDSKTKELVDIGDVNIINYDRLTKIWPLLEKYGIEMVIFDESHRLIHKQTKWSKTALQLSRQMSHVILLTGTPVLNRPVDLINQLDIIGRLKDFGGEWRFKKRYCGLKRGPFGYEANGATNLPELNEKLRRLCYVRRVKEDVISELPSKQRTYIQLQLSHEAMDIYQRASRNIAQWILSNDDEMKKFYEGIEDLPEQKRSFFEYSTRIKLHKAEALVKMSKLRQIVAMYKLKPFIDWVDDFMFNKRKLIIFAIHRGVIDLLEKKLSKYGTVVIHGGITSEERQNNVDAFQNNSNINIIICNLQSGGVGLTLTAASDVAFIEFGFVPAEVIQAEDRAWRIGQTNNVNIYYFYAENTIDMDLIKVLQRKEKVMKGATDGIEDFESSDSLVSEEMSRILKSINNRR